MQTETKTRIEVLKDLNFWKAEIIKAQISDKTGFFNDITVEQRPPSCGSDYGEPVVKDVILDGVLTDVYKLNSNGFTGHKIFLHQKIEE